MNGFVSAEPGKVPNGSMYDELGSKTETERYWLPQKGLGLFQSGGFLNLVGSTRVIPLPTSDEVVDDADADSSPLVLVAFAEPVRRD